MADHDKSHELHTDDDWKRQAQAEKDRLSAELGEKPAAGAAPVEKPAEAAAKPAGGPVEADAGATTRPVAEKPAQAPAGRGLPQASFGLVIQQYATQVMLALGVMPNPATGKAEAADLPLAKHFVDTLGVLQEKTRGNLSQEEQTLLDTSLYELRMMYVDRAGKR